MIKKFKIFENNSPELEMGRTYDEDGGVEFTEIQDYISDDSEVEILYEKEVFKIVRVDDELYVVFNGYFSEIENTAKTIFDRYGHYYSKEEMLEVIGLWADVHDIYYKWVDTSTETIKSTTVYKNYLKNKSAKKFKI